MHKIKIPNDTIDPISAALTAFKHFSQVYQQQNLVIDQKCKDWNRLCYLSHDRSAFFNPHATPEKFKTIEQVIIKAPVVIEDGTKGYQLSRHTRDRDQICPRCHGGIHRDKSFTFYVDERENRIDGCGFCTRNKCGANIKPKDLHPETSWIYIGSNRH